MRTFEAPPEKATHVGVQEVVLLLHTSSSEHGAVFPSLRCTLHATSDAPYLQYGMRKVRVSAEINGCDRCLIVLAGGSFATMSTERISAGEFPRETFPEEAWSFSLHFF